MTRTLPTLAALILAASAAVAAPPAAAPPAAAPMPAFPERPAPASPPTSQPAGNYKSFTVSTYCVVNTLNLRTIEQTWANITSQVKIDKVYIETFRSGRRIAEADIEPLKKFFIDHGVKVAGGMTLVANDSGQFTTFVYANQADRQLLKEITELTAKHFDEIILDDFFFYNTKTDADIAAKGNKSWTDYRIDTMREVAQNSVVGPAHALNPKIKMVIKYPNWYEHFQGLGFDLDKEPQIFDGIYTGTETRDPVLTEQHLQPYESYQIIRYFENIKPGGNGGGWVDRGQYNYIDRYAEQLWDTAFAKAREITLFNVSDLPQNMNAGPRAAWENAGTSFDYQAMLKTGAMVQGIGQPTVGRAAGYALEQADKFMYKMGNPIGLKSYRPPNSSGEDFLHNFLGMIGIPIDLYPTYPADAHHVLLTESAKGDPDIIKKIKASLAAGNNVIITSGLVKALAGKGIEDLIDIEYTGNKIQVTDFHGQGGATVQNSHLDKPIIFPEIKFKTNDAWFILAGVANGNGFPILISDRYSRGTLYILAIPDNYTDLYSMPPTALNLIRNIVTRDLPVRIQGPSQVALYEYDNNTFIVQNFAATDAPITIGITQGAALRNLITDERIAPPPAAPGARGPGRGRGGFIPNSPDAIPARTSFQITLKPHSYQAFTIE